MLDMLSAALGSVRLGACWYACMQPGRKGGTAGHGKVKCESSAAVRMLMAGVPFGFCFDSAGCDSTPCDVFNMRYEFLGTFARCV